MNRFWRIVCTVFSHWGKNSVNDLLCFTLRATNPLTASVCLILSPHSLQTLSGWTAGQEQGTAGLLESERVRIGQSDWFWSTLTVSKIFFREKGMERNTEGMFSFLVAEVAFDRQAYHTPLLCLRALCFDGYTTHHSWYACLCERKAPFL